MKKDEMNRTGPALAAGAGLTTEHLAALHQECRDRLEEAEVDLISVADGTVPVSADLVNRLFREFHSLKSAVAYLQLDSLTGLSHLSESVLAEVRDGNIEFIPEHAGVLLSAADRITEALNRPDPSAIDLAAELKDLNAILNSGRRPVLAPAPPAREEAQRSKPSQAGPARARRLKMLVAEDEFTSRVLLQGLLSHYGECHIAVTGKEAVEAYLAARHSGEGYDLICMDIRMPEMDGPEAVEQIRAIEGGEHCYSTAAARIFMTTGVHDIKAVTASFRALADAYLLKPIQGDDLTGQLRSFGLLDDDGDPTPRS